MTQRNRPGKKDWKKIYQDNSMSTNLFFFPNLIYSSLPCPLSFTISPQLWQGDRENGGLLFKRCENGGPERVSGPVLVSLPRWDDPVAHGSFHHGMGKRKII